ncbi:RAMP superfamily CRISPR-associated protein [Crocosphaera sp. XPORK-15E]|uniref:RAMP superfamily CRISPR-associated protein n=1 Tax=Crocosphaera sp. XPORK-15E TaxID=3110247 RepID=UPI002B20C5D3|nr:RAMP superfamily CRISPR-associated protein [Crocosphaera sp. XPORK-15E]MEA5537023.1 RAMP superfamily CRISPR-associated protein [Crocosphaera sp. XPORK-15E]
MTTNPLQRPLPPRKPQNQALRRPTPRPANSSNSSGGGSRNNGNRGNNNGGNGGNSASPPSPWLNENNEPSPHSTASFVEYLRWMRESDHQYKDGTKVQILQLATEKANYSDRLKILTQRLELMAGKANTFTVKCAWRIRVGGHRGPENILLPAFDALGMPYIPSSTLRGVARTQAIREVMKDKGITDWKSAEKEPEIVKYFGSLDADKQDKAGKIVFFDAYPLPDKHGLAMDMANNIWKWEGNELQYSPNPNPFLSLEEPTFKIALKLVNGIKDPTILERVKGWLIKGLQTGVGSQVNTGYGEFLIAGKGQPTNEFLRVEFALEGQLIHGHQKFTQWQWNDKRNEWQMRGQALAEPRPTAFKSMLRYWFRVFALGVLPPNSVSEWENKLFGGINPHKEYGYLKVSLQQGKVTQKEPHANHQGKNDPVGEQEGILILSFSDAVSKQHEVALKQLYQNLTWLMFNLGGIGQGARRPCYSRQNRERAPWYRGSTFYLDSDEAFWSTPNKIQGLKQQFQVRLKDFYTALNQVSELNFNYGNRRNGFQVTQSKWLEAADANCEIIICSGEEQYGKPYALSVLHSSSFKVSNDYDGNLCGQVRGGVKPSPVWIADLGDFQVVTIFGATENPRQRFFQKIRSDAKEIALILPL